MTKHAVVGALFGAAMMAVGCLQARAAVVLPDDANDRAHVLKLFGELCRDYAFTASQQTGEWVLVKGARKQIPFTTWEYDPEFQVWTQAVATVPSNLDPSGCAIVCAAIDSAKTITVSFKKQQQSTTKPASFPDAQDPTKGSDSEVWLGAEVMKDTSKYPARIWAYLQEDLDPGGKPVACTNGMPDYLSLGHELIHAIHNANGQHSGNYNTEEQVTVGATNPPATPVPLTENGIRRDRKLPPRVKGNCGAVL